MSSVVAKTPTALGHQWSQDGIAWGKTSVFCGAPYEKVG